MLPSNVGAVAMRATDMAASPVMFGGGGASKAKKVVKKVVKKPIKKVVKNVVKKVVKKPAAKKPVAKKPVAKRPVKKVRHATSTTALRSPSPPHTRPTNPRPALLGLVHTHTQHLPTVLPASPQVVKKVQKKVVKRAGVAARGSKTNVGRSAQSFSSKVFTEENWAVQARHSDP